MIEHMPNYKTDHLKLISITVIAVVLISLIVNTRALAATLPVAQNDSYLTPQDTSLNVAEPGVLTNDSDADGHPLIAVRVTDPAHGSLELMADGSFNYTPATGYSGHDSFTYHAFDDGTGYSNIATVTIRIDATPVAVKDSYFTTPDTTLTVPIPGVLVNDTDTDGDTLTAVKVTDPVHGNVTLHADGSLTYGPEIGYTGLDSFTYQVCDGTSYSNIVTITLLVDAPPVANDDNYNIPQDTTLTVPKPGVLANDTDTDGYSLTTVKVTDPAHGTITLAADGSFTYTPETEYTGLDSFTYQAYDGFVESKPANVRLKVTIADSGLTDVNGSIDGNGAFTQKVEAFSEDRQATIIIESGTIGKNNSGLPLDQITINKIDETENPATAVSIVSFTYEGGPGGATFVPSVTIKISYDPAKIPAEVKETDLAVAFFDDGTKGWQKLVSNVDPVTHSITAQMEHMSLFAVICELPSASIPISPPTVTPAGILLNGLKITPNEIVAGQEVNISLGATNPGETGGAYTVTLNIDGDAIESQNIYLEAGQKQNLTFIIKQVTAGNHVLKINDLVSTIDVKSRLSSMFPWLIVGLGVLLAGLVGTFIITKKMRARSVKVEAVNMARVEVLDENDINRLESKTISRLSQDNNDINFERSVRQPEKTTDSGIIRDPVASGVAIKEDQKVESVGPDRHKPTFTTEYQLIRSNIVRELEHNLIIANTSLADKLIPFDTDAWDNNHLENALALITIQKEFGKIYYDINLANTVVVLANRFERRDEAVNQSYLRLCSKISEQIRSLSQPP